MDACLRLLFEASEKSQTTNSDSVSLVSIKEHASAVVGRRPNPSSNLEKNLL